MTGNIVSMRFVCPTPCDGDCEQNAVGGCHEAHQIRKKREHDVDECEANIRRLNRCLGLVNT